ncbi:hypothetical protein NDU88_002085 [Pleurodeles waltl]|uniref:Uncharacterized protein n=1 Tax=Pleurodeles waltl TaxID=8319 RepID=A0AAV7P8P2_PLEWA|nr:hypothetical protein NDU88_002085 [Pleurodeles waltl]
MARNQGRLSSLPPGMRKDDGWKVVPSMCRNNKKNTTTSTTKEQMRAVQEKIVTELKQSSNIFGRNRWRSIVSEEDGSNSKLTKTEHITEEDQLPTIRPTMSEHLG